MRGPGEIAKGRMAGRRAAQAVMRSWVGWRQWDTLLARNDVTRKLAHRHWIAFLDDTGDPGERGKPYFGYAGIVLDRAHLAAFHEARWQLRSSIGSWGERKYKRGRGPGFEAELRDMARLQNDDTLFAGAVIIDKARYSGPWLRELDGKPADSNFLRNYLVRKLLEQAFDGVSYRAGDHIDVVLNRAGESHSVANNLLRYLNGEWTEYGPFAFPVVQLVTHADSLYVEGLQAAHHLATLAREIYRGEEGAIALGREFLCARTVVGSREFVLAEEPRAFLQERKRK